jgi:hypothetical protein
MNETTSTALLISFKMTIKEYKFDGTFFVEYIPEDSNLSTYTYGVTLPYHESPAPTRDEIISRLAGASPQDFWNYELTSKKFDDSERKSLIGLDFENAQELMPKNML